MRLSAAVSVLLAVALCGTGGVVVAQSNYYIIGSTYFNPGDEYPLIVDVSDSLTGDVRVSAEISINNTWKDEVRQLSSVRETVSPGTRRTLSMAVPADIGHNQFSLRVALTGGGLDVVHVSSLHKTYQATDIAQIQLDKSVYKPGQTVHMRIVAVDADLKPYEGKVTVDVKDPKGNHVRRWADVSTDIGVVPLSMELSDQPPLGSWRIEARFDESTATSRKSFSVEEYVLPRWSVDLTLPDYMERSKKPTLRGSIDAKYTYGEGVRGSATITIRRPSYSYSRCACEDEDEDKYTLRRQTVTLSGEKTDFSIEFVLADRYAYSVQVFVAVTEGVTGEVKNDTGSVSIISEPYNVNIEGSGQVKPGLPYGITVKVTRYNEEPLREFDSKEAIVGYYIKVPEQSPEELPDGDGGSSAKLSVGRPLPPRPSGDADVEFIKRSYQLPADGTLSLTLTPPEDAEQIQVEVYYAGQKRTTRYYNKYVALNNVFVNVRQVSEKLNAGESATFRVNASTPVSGFTYAVTADSDGLIQSEDVHVDEPSAVIEFSIPITPRMAPESKLIAYFEHNGELIADSITLNVDGAFQNDVSIEFSGDREEPGADIRLSVNAAPNSFVGISAIDASLKLLGSGHEIRRDQFVPEHGRYRSSYDYNNHAVDELRHAQLVMFTDTLIYDGRVAPDPCATQHNRMALASPGAGRSGASYKVSYDADSDGIAQSAERGSGPASTTKVRKFFPETWLWLNATASEDGSVDIESTVPDTITSYVATAFSMSKELGIGISDEAKLEVFRSFFITLHLPYSVIRGEDVEVKISVFNYLSSDKRVSVTIERSEEFEAVFSELEVKSDNLLRVVNVGSKDASSLSFMIRPSKVGMVKLKVSAQTDGAADAVVRELLVKPEGVTVHRNDAIFVDVDSGDDWQQTYEPQFPEDVVEDSQRVEVSVSGDIMGSSVQGGGNLLRMPHGCGEQNMAKFAPNIYITNYLQTTSQLTDELAEKAKRFMLSGYQRQLTYQRDDGSFSSFGDNDDSGSTWLTAFVIKSLVEAKPYIYIDQDILNKASTWLVSKQKDGKFMEVGRIVSQVVQGGSGGDVALTAYTLIALRELEAEWQMGVEAAGESDEEPQASALSPRFGETLSLSVNFLEDNLDDLTNGYEVAIVSYALHVSGSNRAEDAYTKLQTLAVTDDNDLVYWRGEEDEFDDPPVVVYDSWLRTTKSQARIRPVDIEATSYALLTMALREDIERGVPTLRWLSARRNSLGGFISTQDTVVGLQALTEFAALVYDANTDLSVSVGSDLDFTHSFDVNDGTRILLQSVVVPEADAVNELAFGISGQGTALLQIATSYNVIEDTSASNVFSIEVDSRVGGGRKLKLGVCASYQLAGSSNMAVMEVSMPSGYTADMEEARSIADTDVNVQRVEGEYGNTRLNFYFNSLHQEDPVCVSVSGRQEFEVANRKPSTVRVYDYYDTRKTSTQYYTIDVGSGDREGGLGDGLFVG